MNRHAVVKRFFAAALLCTATLYAESPCHTQLSPREDAQAIAENRGVAALAVALQQLHTRASMLMVTAHPDDEDGATLAYTSRTLGASVSLLTLNRGEGGANEMSADLWDALGLVRTEELLQADRYYCATQYFTTAADYGFSKGLDEAVQKWGGDDKQVFADVVRVVRLTRPLIITSVFVGGPSDGHGNHAAAGMWAQKVFNAAGDPNVFPDQIKAGLRPWNPLKEYARVPPSLAPGAVSPKGLYDYATHHWAPAGVQNYITGKFESGAVSTTILIPTGTYSPVNGLSDQQISRTGLGFQKSQNGGAMIPPAGPAASAFHRFGTRLTPTEKDKSFFDGIDISLEGIATLAGTEDHAFLTEPLHHINDLVEQAIHTNSVADPSAIAPVLAEGLKATNTLVDQVTASHLSEDAKYNILHELRIKQSQFNDAITLSLGLSLAANVTQAPPPTPRASASPANDEERAALRLTQRRRPDQPTFPMAIPGQHFPVLVHLAEGSATPVTIDDISVTLQGASSVVKPLGDHSGQLQGNGTLDSYFQIELPTDVPATRPYFGRPDLGAPAYQVRDPAYSNMALAPYPLAAHVQATYNGVPIHLDETVQVIQHEVGPGIVYHPLPIGPAISVTMQQSAGVVPLGSSTFPVSVKIHNDVDGPAQGTVHLDLPAGWKSTPATETFTFAQDGQEQLVTFNVTPARITEQAYNLTAVATYNQHDYKEGYLQVGYPGLRPYYLYSDATYKTTGTNVRIAPNLQVAYIEGSGDDVPASLENLGVHVHFLSQADLASGDLAKYDVVLVGVRAYAVRADLRTFNNRLLDYVKRGGSVVVQYQTPEFDHNFGPYPYSMTNDPEEVTDEASPVTFDAQSPVFQSPNPITAKDFEGWVEERGSKFMVTWDPQYQAPLETHDPGQDPQKGGLLIAHYGSGTYVYTAYAFYRELPLGVPGAYRLFANLLSLSKNPQAK